MPIRFIALGINQFPSAAMQSTTSWSGPLPSLDAFAQLHFANLASIHIRRQCAFNTASLALAAL
jgi:hypothetical protein